MGIFSRSFGRRKKYDDDVKLLFTGAKALAVSSFTTFSETFDELKTIDPHEWDFFVTVAGISVGLMALNNELTNDSEYHRLTNILSKEIIEWDNRGESALLDLLSIMKKNQVEMMTLPPDEFTKTWAVLLGFWCLVNLGLEAPEEPSELMIALGMFQITSFHGWFRQK